MTAPHHLARIAPVAMAIKTGGVIEEFASDSSFAVFARVREASRKRQEIEEFRVSGRAADAESLAALNAFLRGRPRDPYQLHPWDRLSHAGHDSKYEFRALLEHLRIRFL